MTSYFLHEVSDKVPFELHFYLADMNQNKIRPKESHSKISVSTLGKEKCGPVYEVFQLWL